MSGPARGYKAGTTRPPYVHPHVWDSWGEERKHAERLKWSDLKPKLDKARKGRGIKHIIDPQDEDVYMSARAEAMRSLKRARESPAMPVDPTPLVHMALTQISHAYETPFYVGGRFRTGVFRASAK